MVLPVIMALAQLAPSVLGLVTRDKTATQAVHLVSQVAQAVTGEPNDDAALLTLQKNPEKLAEYKAKINEHAATMYELETKRAEIVNNTMHLEAANKDRFVRWMRPLFGYTVIYMLFMTFNIVIYTLLKAGPDKAIEVIKAFSTMQWIYAFALSAMGVYISKRSKDKNPGVLGIFGALAKRIGK